MYIFLSCVINWILTYDHVIFISAIIINSCNALFWGCFCCCFQYCLFGKYTIFQTPDMNIKWTESPHTFSSLGIHSIGPLSSKIDKGQGVARYALILGGRGGGGFCEFETSLFYIGKSRPVRAIEWDLTSTNKAVKWLYWRLEVTCAVVSHIKDSHWFLGRLVLWIRFVYT